MGGILEEGTHGGWPKYQQEILPNGIYYTSYGYRTQYKDSRPVNIKSDPGDIAMLADHWTKKRKHVYNVPWGAGYFSHNEGEGYGTTYLDGHAVFVEDEGREIMYKKIGHQSHSSIKNAWIKYFDGF